MRKVIVNIILFVVAMVLLLTVGVYGLFYGMIITIFKKNSFVKWWGDTLYQLNVGIDQLGNVMLSVFLNHSAIKEYDRYPFGKVDQTISHVLAVNHLHYDNLTPFGVFIVKLLEKLDPGHTINSL